MVFISFILKKQLSSSPLADVTTEMFSAVSLFLQMIN
jgi:hypothetical protein